MSTNELSSELEEESIESSFEDQIHLNLSMVMNLKMLINFPLLNFPIQHSVKGFVHR